MPSLIEIEFTSIESVNNVLAQYNTAQFISEKTVETPIYSDNEIIRNGEVLLDESGKPRKEICDWVKVVKHIYLVS